MQFKNLIFDFDGVLVESNFIKNDGFRSLFKDYPKNEILQLMTYVENNGGFSRYNKIRYFFEVIRRESIDVKDMKIWANRYSKLVKEKVIQAESVIGIDFFLNYGEKFQSAIVSGSDQEELREICKLREINQYFIEILGSPVEKAKNIDQLIQKKNWDRSKCLYIGDSKNDLDAAKSNNIAFLGRISGITDWTKFSVNTIKNLNELYGYLKKTCISGNFKN